MDLDPLDPLGRPQSEMKPGIAGGGIAPATRPLGDLATSTGLDRHASPHAIAVGPRAFEAESDEVPARLGPIPKHDQGLILGGHQGVETAVVVQVADCETSADVELLEGRTGAFGDVDQASRLAAEEELSRHGQGDEWPEVADMAVGGHQIEVAVIVGVQEGGPESQSLPAGGRQADRGGSVGEHGPAQVLEEGRRTRYRSS